MKSKYKYFVGSDEKPVLSLHEFPDDNFEFDEEMLNADSTPEKNTITSQPYIIIIRNTSGAPLTDIKVLGANQNLGAGNYGNSGFPVNITMGIGSITYAELLFQTLTQVFTVGLTYLFSTNPSQVVEPFTLQYKDSNGDVAQKVLIPTIDPYQSRNRAIPIKEKYTVDGTTMFTFSMLPGATLRLYLYPTEKINLRNLLGDGPTEQQYGGPEIDAHRPVTISANIALALKNQ